MRRMALLASCAAVAVLTACQSNKETIRTQTDLDEIKRQVYEINRLTQENKQLLDRLQAACGAGELRSVQADINENVETLRADLQALSARLDSLTRQEAAISEQLTQCLSRGPAVATQLPALGGETAPATGGGPPLAYAPPQQRAEELYKTAYGDYIQDNFDLAIQGFRDLLVAYPDSELADNAQYWIAESHYRQGRINDALLAFDAVIRDHPNGDKLADAMVRKAFLLFERRQPAQAALLLNDVIERFPGTPAASQAQEKLRDEGYR